MMRYYSRILFNDHYVYLGRKMQWLDIMAEFIEDTYSRVLSNDHYVMLYRNDWVVIVIMLVEEFSLAR